jgi:thiol-disulfide isomerase/thioredoxin
MKRLIIFYFFAAALFCGLAAGPQGLEAQALSSEVVRAFAQADLPLLRRPQAPPDFSLPGLNGETFSLSAHRGQVIFLNFWATWCPPCRSEMPSMEILYRRLEPLGLVFAAVDIQEKPDLAQAYIAEGGYSFPVVVDFTGRVSTRYGVRAIPSTFIIARDGNVVAAVTGALDWSRPEVIAALEALLKDGQ